jgi:hypothetical protein
MSKIVVQFTLTGLMAAEADEEYKRTARPPLHWSWYVTFTLAGTLLVFWTLSSRQFVPDRVLRWLLSAEIAVGGALAFCLIKRDVERASGFKDYAVLYELTENALEKTTALVQAKVEWPAFSAYHETAGFFFIRSGNTSLDLIPKRLLGMEEVEAVRALLTAKLPREKEHLRDPAAKNRLVLLLCLILVAGFILMMIRGKSSRMTEEVGQDFSPNLRR